jgi:hypothetical protein
MLALLYFFCSVVSGNWVGDIGVQTARVVLIPLAMFGIAFFLRWNGWTRDRRVQRRWLDATAVVDTVMLKALEDAKLPISVVRTVETVGSRKSLRPFRHLVRSRSGSDLTEEQLDMILHAARTARYEDPRRSAHS